MSEEATATGSGYPLTSLQTVILTTGPFLFIWSLLRQYTIRNGAFPIASILISVNSQLYALFNALLSYLLIQSYINSQHSLVGEAVTVTLPFGLSIPFVNKTILTISDLGLIYHYSKIYEYIDVLLMVAEGKVIGEHMAFHHVTTPFLTYFRVLNCSGSDWRVFALANTIHHTLMYAFFGGLGSWLGTVKLYTGWLQLILGIAVDALWMYRTKAGNELGPAAGVLEIKEDEATNRAIAILFLGRYAMLYWDELKKGRAGMSKEERERRRAAQGKGQQESVKEKKKK